MGWVVDVRLTQASGTAEREAAEAMIGGKAACRRATLGADRGYDTHGFVANHAGTQHRSSRGSERYQPASAIDHRTT
jgi:hypothetical protein